MTASSLNAQSSDSNQVGFDSFVPREPVRFAVVDCETTGLYNADRVIEVAIVVIDGRSGQVVNEYDTLINPLRDVGPVGIHGIVPSMLQLAPTFDEIAGSVAQQLQGAVLVAHNLPFDTRMLVNEFDRLGAVLDPGHSVCTLRLTGERLNLACDRYGIELSQHHRALADARATAQLLVRLLDEEPDSSRVSVNGLTTALTNRTHRRDATASASSSVLERLIKGSPYPTSDEAVVSYLDTLDWVLDDLVITSTERDHLNALARSLGLSPERVHSAHKSYLDMMIHAARRDSVITDEEHEMLRLVASLLGLDGITIPEVSAQTRLSGIPVGATVCLTGEMSRPREELEMLAVAAGLRPLASVTKACQVLVAVDPTSQSGKARKARQYGIPIIDEESFLREIGH